MSKYDSLRQWTVDVIKDGKVVEYEYYSGDYGDVMDDLEDDNDNDDEKLRPKVETWLRNEIESYKHPVIVSHEANANPMTEEETDLHVFNSLHHYLTDTLSPLSCVAMGSYYGYGIVDRDGKPYYDESCVCQDSEPMQEIISQLNQTVKLNNRSVVYDVRCPYRVVRLLYQEIDSNS